MVRSVPSALLVCALLAGGAAHAAAEEIFSKFQERVVQVRVLEKGTSSKFIIGSGFYVSADGLVVTNYHVVAPLVFQPKDFTVELLGTGGKSFPAVVLDVDVAHDLAVLQAQESPPSAFELLPIEPPKGTRLYSLGNPHDVGFSILEGTYNGIIAESLYEHVHFSGSLNGGVSGGPSLDAEGRVVGVNVSTYGNQLSFLVPVKFARALVDRVVAAGKAPVPALLDSVRAQLLTNQDRIARMLLDAPLPATRLGRWELPGRWLPQLKEWANRSKDDEPRRRYTWTSWGARTEDSVYLRDGQDTGTVAFTHQLYEPAGATPLQLYSEAGDSLGSSQPLAWEGDAHLQLLTRWRCREQLVQQGRTRLKAWLCLRAHKKFEGLYDGLLRYLTLDERDRAAVGELTLGGFSLANVEAISRRFLGGVTWKP